LIHILYSLHIAYFAYHTIPYHTIPYSLFQTKEEIEVCSIRFVEGTTTINSQSIAKK
jgi:hypothetical protein